MILAVGEWLVRNIVWVGPLLLLASGAVGYYVRKHDEDQRYDKRRSQDQQEYRDRLNYEEMRGVLDKVMDIIQEGDGHGYLLEPRDPQHIIGIATRVRQYDRQMGEWLSKYYANWVLFRISEMAYKQSKRIEDLRHSSALRVANHKLGDQMLERIKELKK